MNDKINLGDLIKLDQKILKTDYSVVSLIVVGKLPDKPAGWFGRVTVRNNKTDNASVFNWQAFDPTETKDREVISKGNSGLVESHEVTSSPFDFSSNQVVDEGIKGAIADWLYDNEDNISVVEKKPVSILGSERVRGRQTDYNHKTPKTPRVEPKVVVEPSENFPKDPRPPKATYVAHKPAPAPSITELPGTHKTIVPTFKNIEVPRDPPQPKAQVFPQVRIPPQYTRSSQPPVSAKNDPVEKARLMLEIINKLERDIKTLGSASENDLKILVALVNRDGGKGTIQKKVNGICKFWYEFSREVTKAAWQR